MTAKSSKLSSRIVSELGDFKHFYTVELPKNTLYQVTSFIYSKCRDFYWSRKYDFYRHKYSISKDFKLRKKAIEIIGDGEFKAGQGGHLGRRVLIKTCDGCKVKLGDYVRIGNDSKIYTVNNVPSQDLRKKDSLLEKKKGDVIIKDGAWIGDNVFIKSGITIGENSVVGANSVVTKDVPAEMVVGGTPAEKLYSKGGCS